jgi:hypothetical protein
MYGGDAPELRRIAIAVLGMAPSSCPVERSVYLQKSIHTTSRNRLGHARVKNLVFCHSNMNLLYEDDGVEDNMFVDFYEATLSATAEKGDGTGMGYDSDNDDDDDERDDGGD